MTLLSLKSVSAATQAMNLLAQRNQEPTWSRDKRRAGLLALRSLPFPTHKLEEWRYTKLEHFTSAAALCAPQADLSGDEQAVAQECPPTLSYLDGQGEHQGCPDSIVFCPFLQAMLQDASVEKFYFVDNSHQRQYHSALNAAWRNGGVWLDVPRNTVCDKVLKAEHNPTAPGFFPHTAARVEANSQIACLEHFRGDDSDRLAVANIELHLDVNASLQYGIIFDWGQQTKALVNLHVYLNEGSKADIFIMDIGGADNKVSFTSDITGGNASCKVYGLTYVEGQQNFEVNLLQQHHAGHSVSDVLYHCAVNDKARSVFAGNISVAHEAQKSDAYQKNRNLLISPQAQALSQPQLEIIADDVRCTHGANFTSYDPEQQFYLQSRGVDPVQAQRLIVAGFLHEIVGHFGLTPGRLFLSHLLHRRLHSEWMSFSDMD